eukprot:COSAG04_NODE_20233_length_398_cov_0.618729_2_plen_70_part_00
MQALQALEQVGQLALAPQRQDTLAEDAENPLYQRRPLIPTPAIGPAPGPAPGPARRPLESSRRTHATGS